MGAVLLLAAAVVWGFAFVPQKLTVTSLPPLQATAVRFAIAAPLAILVAGPRLRRPGVDPKHALLLGVILFFAYALQTAGLMYAPVARVSLITGMYAVFVPLFAPLLGHARPTPLHWAGALLAFAGVLALVGVVGGPTDALLVPLNIGDVLVLLHSVVGAFQVLLVGKLTKTADPYALNALQLAGVMVLAVPAALVVEGVPPVMDLDADTWLAFGYLAAFSTVLAFTFQILGQRHASPPAAAVIMLVETPVGVLGAMLFLGERMGLAQWAGAAVLIAGVALSLHAEALSRRRAETSAP